jgi:hypothetical protein
VQRSEWLCSRFPDRRDESSGACQPDVRRVRQVEQDGIVFLAAFGDRVVRYVEPLSWETGYIAAREVVGRTVAMGAAFAVSTEESPGSTGQVAR